jgi:exonuclease VII large subunit
VGELHEQVNALGHLKIVISRMSMQKLQDLQAGLVQEIRNRGEEEHRELERIRDERAQLQEKYDTTLQQKREVEGRVEEALKKKYEVEERVEMTVKEKDEVESMVKKTQATVQKLYKAIPEVPLVVEATMEEQVQMIGEVIKGF